ncbi:hypothetical protein, partial [Enterobacter hormaechei]|uniref:hypothetical protein n=1 Tax=Enterobacter hormaechei TaxID=158836 RepID=UPI0013D0F2A3
FWDGPARLRVGERAEGMEAERLEGAHDRGVPVADALHAEPALAEHVLRLPADADVHPGSDADDAVATDGMDEAEVVEG